MAFLVDVFRLEEDHPPLPRRQSPLLIEDKFIMVMDLSDLYLFDEYPMPEGRDLYDFMQKYALFSERELSSALQVGVKDIMAILTDTIPCVGCRRSVERFYYQMMEIGELALDPLTVNMDGILHIRKSVISSPHYLCSLLSFHRERLSRLADSQPRSKKSRRCLLHSWDVQKSRPVTNAWKELWEVMAEKCRAEVLLIDYGLLLGKLENYLKKHRFCSECRTKVMKAYHLLVEEGDATKEKGFVAGLYSKIKRCSPGKHIHLQADTSYIESLISRAEPELMGNRRERHAKTMEIAQEEVLTCIGICIYDRLHRIYLRLKEEEFTCRILSAAAISALNRQFETLVEQKTGITRLELLYREITEQDRQQKQRKEMKKLRKKRKKHLNQGKREVRGEEEEEEEEEEEGCDSCAQNDENDSGERFKLQVLDRKTKPRCSCEDCILKQTEHEKGPRRSDDEEEEEEGGNREEQCISCCDGRQDNGYSSEHADAAPNSGSNSSDGSDVACSEGFCDHEGECLSDRKSHRKPINVRLPLSLEEMLEVSQSDEEDFIPAEEIRAFRARNTQVDVKRSELRERLKNQFQQMLSRSQQARYS